MIIKNANIFQEDGTFETGDISISGEHFVSGGDSREVIDASGSYAIPGLIDVHLHGDVGYDFSDSEVEGIEKIARYQAENGITAICPTTMTLPEEHLTEACRRIAASRASDGAEIIGINLEGPFISKEKKGAQNPAYIRLPDVQMVGRLQAASGGLVKMIAVAPEISGTAELIEEFADKLVCYVAHTTADYETALAAFKSGARHVAHLYNAMAPFSHREPGVVGAAMDSPECFVELICDNVHVSPSVVRATMRMFGDGRVVMVSDSMMAAGLSDGDYKLGGQDVVVQGNTARIKQSGAIAGSVTNLMDCVRTAVRVMDIPLGSAVKCASVNPAKLLGVFDRRGSIEPGKYADLVLLSEDLSTRSVFLKGKRLL